MTNDKRFDKLFGKLRAASSEVEGLQITNPHPAGTNIPPLSSDWIGGEGNEFPRSDRGKKGVRWIYFRFLILSLGFLLAGCSSLSTSTAYYYRPEWTRGGSIILVKGLQTGSTLTETVSTLDATGANEAGWFDVTSTSAYGLSCSPATDYVAYMDDSRNDLYGRLVIRNIAGTNEGLSRVEHLFSPRIVAFDWSNNGLKLVYCTTSEVHTVNLDGSGDAKIVTTSEISAVAWKFGSRIAFVHVVGTDKILSLVNSDGTGRVNLLAAASVDKPQISAANTNEVFGIAGGSYCKVDVSASAPATTEVLSNFAGGSPKLSPTGNRAVYSKPSETSGIYILTLATAAETKVK